MKVSSASYKGLLLIPCLKITVNMCPMVGISVGAECVAHQKTRRGKEGIPGKLASGVVDSWLKFIDE